MSKLNLTEKLAKKEGKKANGFLYWALGNIIAKTNSRKMNLTVIDNVGVKKIEGPYILVSNHTSRCDWQYLATAMWPNKMNFVASYTEFHRAHLHFIFDLMNVIPKRNFVSDTHTIKMIMQVVKKGGNVVFFPEGKSSISGTNQPVMPGTAKLFKHLNVPVYSATIRGGYMSNTQWNIKDRPGKVEVTINKLFTPEETQSLSVEEMDRMTNEAIWNDDFVWNEDGRIHYNKADDLADKLETHLFWCPKCLKELSQKGKGTLFTCNECGNSVKIADNYKLVPQTETAVVPKNLRVWYELQRRNIYREIKNNPDFVLVEENVKLGLQPNDHYVDKSIEAEVVGEGTITLSRDEFSYVGTAKGEPYEVHLKMQNVYSMVMPCDSTTFGCFVNGHYHEFVPTRPVVTKWILAIEEVHRAIGGKWQNTIPQQQWIYSDDNNPIDCYLDGFGPEKETV